VAVVPLAPAVALVAATASIADAAAPTLPASPEAPLPCPAPPATDDPEAETRADPNDPGSAAEAADRVPVVLVALVPRPDPAPDTLALTLLPAERRPAGRDTVASEAAAFPARSAAFRSPASARITAFVRSSEAGMLCLAAGVDPVVDGGRSS